MATILESKLLTAEEYGQPPDNVRLTELVRGRIVEMNRPDTSHGYFGTSGDDCVERRRRAGSAEFASWL